MADAPIRYPDKRRGLSKPVGKVVSFDKAERRWVSTKIRVYTGPRKALQCL